MQKPQENYAFIDHQNLYRTISHLGWKIDWRRLRVFLQEKYGVKIAYQFIGYIARNRKFYDFLEKCGYTLIFKEVLQDSEENIKGNCDAELVLQAMIDLKHYARAIIMTGDGDFSCLVKYLRQQQKLQKLIIPNSRKYSSLLKKCSLKEERLFSEYYEKEV